MPLACPLACVSICGGILLTRCLISLLTRPRRSSPFCLPPPSLSNLPASPQPQRVASLQHQLQEREKELQQSRSPPRSPPPPAHPSSPPSPPDHQPAPKPKAGTRDDVWHERARAALPQGTATPLHIASTALQADGAALETEKGIGREELEQALWAREGQIEEVLERVIAGLPPPPDFSQV